MTSQLTGVCLTAAALLITSSPAGAGPVPTALPKTFDVPSIDKYLASEAERDNRVGFSVAIVKEGQVVLNKGYGKRSLADGRPVDTNTLFAIGSVSKQFTCACILLLAEEGKLSVKDHVSKYFTNLTSAKEITLLDLMNHVSGYPDYYPLDFVDRRMTKAIAPDELLRQYAGGKLDFDPSTQWSYSNTGYILLGRVVEKVSGESLGAFLAKRIFTPLGMDHSFYELDSSDPRLATGYTTFLLGDPEVVYAEAPGWLGGAGGIYSTPGDLARWDLALVSGKVLKPDSYTLMTTARSLKGGKITDYGCGLSIRFQGGRQVLTHNGAVSGFNTWNGVVPSTKSAVIVTANLEGGYGSIPGQIFSLLIKETPHIPTVGGARAAEVARRIFVDLQKGKVDRQQFGEEFNVYLTDPKIAGASRRFKPYGVPTGAETVSTHERGGMEVTMTRLTFKTGPAVRVQMYRTPNGKIEQYFVSAD